MVTSVHAQNNELSDNEAIERVVVFAYSKSRQHVYTCTFNKRTHMYVDSFFLASSSA